MNDCLYEIARACERFRIETLHKTQADVANETGYSRSNVSEFENGRNRNLALFVYYIEHGLPLSTIERIVKNG